MSKARILLASATDWPFPARLAGAFAELGARVEAVCPRTNPLRHAAAPARLLRFSPWRPLASLTRALAAAEPDFVIPCDDMMAGLLWRLGQRRANIAPLLTKSGVNVFPRLSARNEFLRQAADAGAPTAQTMALPSAAALDRAIGAFGFPLVLKADGFWGGDGVVIARDRNDAQRALARLGRSSPLGTVLRALRRGEPQALARLWTRVKPRPGAQRFIAGRPATSSIACWRGQVLAANHFDVRVSNGTGPATVIAPCDDAVMMDAATRIAARFGLSGFYGLDYMRDGEGKVFLLEINPRATPTSHLALGPGRDLAAALLAALGHPVPDRPAVTRKDCIALFPQELNRDRSSPHLATAHHDLPLDDSRLAAALAPSGVALTRFSSGNSGLSGLTQAPKPLSR
jgi:formate-dependent phosphoribosylglycinamide formyltransferase (GAR transformylase)